MLDIGWSELLVVAVVMIVVVGPKDLPKMLRAFGKATARMRATANEFKQQFNEALKEAELDDVKTIIDETRKLDPRSKITQVFDPIRSAGEDLRSGLQSTTSTSSVSTCPATPEKLPRRPIQAARQCRRSNRRNLRAGQLQRRPARQPRRRVSPLRRSLLPGSPPPQSRKQ